MKNIDLICNFNSSAVAPSEGLLQEDQSVNLKTILLLHNWSMEDPEKHFSPLRDAVSLSGTWTDGKANEEY